LLVIEDVAFEVLDGLRPVLEREADMRAIGPRPMAVAQHRASRGGFAAVLFLIHRRDGLRQVECVMTRSAQQSGWDRLLTVGGPLADLATIIEDARHAPVVVLTGRIDIDDVSAG
jgi:hypothetical protein